MLSKFSVRRPYTILVGVVIVLVLGYLSFTNMSMDFLPSMEMPYSIVMTSYPGASPEEVETVVTAPVEAAMARISNVKSINSISNANLSVVIMEFNDGTDMNATSIDMRESLDQIKTYWDDSVANPTIMKINPDMMPIMVAAIDFDGMKSAEVSNKATDDIIPELESIPGVASVNISGQVKERVDITLNEEKIEKMNKKVADALEGKFEDAEKKITSGQNKIKKGKDTLSNEKNEAAQKMAEGQTKLGQAGSQINEGLKQIDDQIAKVKEQQAKLKESEKELNKGKAALAAQKKSVSATVKSLEKALDLLKKAKTTLAQIDKNMAEIQAKIDAAGGADTSALEAQLAGLKATRNAIINELEKNGVKEDEIDGKIDEVESGLKQAKSGLAEIEKQEKTIKTGEKQIKTAKKKIAAGLAKLNAMKKKLKAGKITTEKALEQLNKQQILAGIELSVAQAGLNSGEQQMKTAKKEFKNTKKTTKDSTDLIKILTKEMVENILKAENFDMPAGYVEEGATSYLVRVGEKFASAKDIEDLVILDMDIDGLDPIRLSDVCDVATTDDSDEVYTVLNGNPAVAVTMQKSSGFSTGDVTDAVLARFDELEKEYEGLHMSVLMNQGVYIDFVVDSVIQNLLYGAILAIIVLLIFLRDFRPTIIVACSIPLSLVAAIVAMYFSGVTLNIISLSGLALGVGMLVDNSVVVIENIYRMRGEGAGFRKAAIEGAKQVSGAIISSTLTTICVFAPIIFTEGITRQLFVDLGLTLAYTLTASLIIAMTLVPAMSAGMLRRKSKGNSKIMTAIINAYMKVIRPVLKFKWLVVIGAFAMLGLSIFLAVQRGASMFPDMQSTQMTITMTPPKDTDEKQVRKMSDQAIEKMLEVSDIERVGAMSGSGSYMSSLSGGSQDAITMYVILKEDREYSNDEIKEMILDKTSDINSTFDVNTSAMDMSALTGSGIDIHIKGRNLDKLRQISEDLMKKLEGVDGLKDIKNELEESGEEFRITVDKAKAMKYSLTVAQVFNQIRTKVAESSSSVKLSTDERDYEIYVKSDSDENLTRQIVQQLKMDYTDVQTQKSKKVKLNKIATFQTVPSPNSIKRDGQSRYVAVKASIEDGYIVNNVAAEVDKITDNYELPSGYTFDIQGENEATMEAVGQLLLMLLLAVVLMYLIMVAQFQGLRAPFIILFTIPLAFTGGFLGLFISGSDVSVISMVGFVMLSGIIVNNGIVLVDYTNQLRIKGEGMEKKEAIVLAGGTRLRPILMTAITTVLGLLPMVINKNMGSDMAKPMAIVVIGGLIYGTLLTLFVVPCMYDMLAKKKMKTEAELDRLESQMIEDEPEKLQETEDEDE
ncbi:MAG: efflux RND transporter permease subunit [Eubacterium sp.]|nr:efflux RND transporter permease subunit [Eubacterium sp.]